MHTFKATSINEAWSDETTGRGARTNPEDKTERKTKHHSPQSPPKTNVPHMFQQPAQKSFKHVLKTVPTPSKNIPENLRGGNSGGETSGEKMKI